MEPTEYVVRIHGKTRAGQPYNGTGFFINSRGDVATCWHVVRDADEILVDLLPKLTDLRYEVKASHVENDVALLQCYVPLGIKTAYATLHSNWLDCTEVKDAVNVWGYSAAANSYAPLVFQCSISGFSPKFSLIMLNGDVNRGDSGGPILNRDEQVIGIARFKDYIRDGHAMTIPVSLLSHLLKANGIETGAEAGTGNHAKQAIVDLPDLMREARVNDAVQAYSGIFEKASQQITILTNYKEVHDLLHDVQYGCYYRLEIDAEHFPDDEQARYRIFVHASEMRKYAWSADGIVKEALERRDRISRIRDQLKDVSDALQLADEQQDKKECDRAVRLLRALLSGGETSIFNAFLNEAALSLDMGGLTKAMTGVYRSIANTYLDAAKVERFQLGVNDMEELAQELHARIKEHDVWQQIDDKLRRIHDSRASLLSELEGFWPRLSSDLKAVCELAQPATGSNVAVATVSDWVPGLVQQTANLETALVSGEMTQASRHFGRLHQQAAECFHRIDKKLLETCEKISKVKDPLQRLVEILK
jgi:hypothetical protein